MLETDFNPIHPWGEDGQMEWNKLSSREKFLCITYKSQLMNNVKIKSELILMINDIHEKYPEFHMGCVP